MTTAAENAPVFFKHATIILVSTHLSNSFKSFDFLISDFGIFRVPEIS
jgi:hypothetical protein